MPEGHTQTGTSAGRCMKRAGEPGMVGWEEGQERAHGPDSLAVAAEPAAQ